MDLNVEAATTAGTQVSNFARTISQSGHDLKPHTIETLQINITKLCNQACVHCHVDSSPRRREAMSPTVIAAVIKVLAENESIKNLDITGGAPELHPQFKELVVKARSLGKKVMVRHNLTVVADPHPLTGESLADLPQFFAEQKVEVISSLPYYQEYFTDKQRGSGVFKKSISTLKELNQVGYGKPGTGLVLNLVYNPVGTFLPPPQADLQKSYKRHLKEEFDIEFNELFALTNMPIHRFKAQLKRLGSYEEYMEKLIGAFNPAAAEGIMCRSIISVDYEGRLFDCDFNQVLDLPITSIESLEDWDMQILLNRSIRTREHCFGCTAGAGSSCGGNTTDG